MTELDAPVFAAAPPERIELAGGLVLERAGSAHVAGAVTAVNESLEHLRPWLDRFDPDQLLVLPSEGLYRDPAAAYARVLEFIGLPPLRLRSYEVFNDRRGGGMDDAVRAELTAYYRPYTEALQARLGMRFDWS